ncbi:MAG: hypothetical protein QOF42_104 [Gammaproteobacteria bacterium]|nr:hypothetical protein [Gammaproteobacteria bacterium]
MVDIPVQVAAAAVAGVDCFIKDLSLSGAFVRSDRDLRLHTLIDVRIELPPPTTRIAIVKAYISRKVQEGVGIEWCEFAPTIVKDLLRSAVVRFPL